VEKFKDALLRQLIWYSLFTEVRDAQLRSNIFLDLIRNKFDSENDPKLKQVLLQRAESILSAFVPRTHQSAEAKSLFDFIWEKLADVTDRELWTIFLDSGIAFAGYNKESTKTLLESLDKKIGAFELTQKMRWRVVIRAASWDLDDGKLISGEEKRDNSDEGQRFAITARYSINSSTGKAEAWATFINPETDKKMSYYVLAAALAGFQWPHQWDTVKEYSNKFF